MPTRRRTRRRRPYGRRRRYTPRYRQPQQHYTTSLRYNVLKATSNAIGQLPLTFNCTNMSSALDWGNIAALWDQYRVIQCSIRFFPITTDGNANPARDIAPLYAINDYDDTVSLTSTATALGYQNVRVLNMFKQWKHTMRFSTKPTKQTTDNIGWLDVDSVTTNNFATIKMFAENLDADTDYGYYIIEHVIQLKNRR